ncbi:MAG TPA: adenylosuccinate lyase [Patescibacteria group bacterium]|nr:adenylosuccinate lyase [Patescibacteria group bacterium]
MDTSIYQNPLNTRYASKEMSFIFSDDYKFSTWRKLWVALAESEMQLGLHITEQQIEELKQHIYDINYEDAEKREKETRHDVMSHVHAYGLQCPTAKPIIHLGATSAYVGDNTDVIQMTEGLKLIKSKLINTMNNMALFASKYKDLPTLGFTHFQAAQLTTVGKRCTLWLQDFLMDLEELEFQLSRMKLRGVKGTTGTQASFMSLFSGDHEKVRRLDQMVAEKMGFEKTFAVTGQTYSRKLDSQVLNVLAQIAESAYKFSNDMRLLQHLKEVEEPFEKQQIGSSAMAYKRNPMRSERIGALARFVVVNTLNPAITAATQWFERTLDDSANKRLAIPQAFLAVDSILNIMINVTSGLVVYEKMIQKHVDQELPFMATESILMEAVMRGGDRQELHEKIRVYSMEAGKRVKEEGLDNNLIDLIKQDNEFKLTDEEIDGLMDAKNFIGRASEQVDEFLEEYIYPILQNNMDNLNIKVELKV